MMHSIRTRAIGAAALAAGLVVAAEGCRAPTQITVDVIGEVPYRAGMKVAIQIAAAGEAERATTRVTTTEGWTYGASLGTVVVGPEGSADAADVRVVLAIDRDPSTCSADDARGCVVYRRRVTFVPGEAAVVRAVLRSPCLGVFCDASTSCRADKSCGAIGDDAPGPAPTGVASEGTDDYSREVVLDRPRHYYRFDETTGTVAKDEMGRADGTYDGAVRLGVTGALDASRATGAYFDGRGAKVTVPALEDIPGALSIEAWIRSDAPIGDAPTVVERLDTTRGGDLFGYRLSVPPSFEARLELFRGSDLVSAAVQRKRNFGAGYTHIVAVAHAGNVRIYVNGKLDRDNPYRDEPPPPLVSPLVVGSGSAGPFRGAIDELAIYDYPLQNEAIARHIVASGTKLDP